MNERHNDIKAPVADTCEWLLRHDTYRQWISQSQGCLWLMGNPGAGKSTLLKFALKHRATQESSKHRLIVSFFFHGRGSGIQRSSFGLFRSLLHQILSRIPSLLSEFTSIYREKTVSIGNYGKDWEWHEAELRDFMVRALSKNERLCPITLFIDALDEGGDDTARDLMDYFSTMKTSEFHLCISCRYYPAVKLGYGSTIRVEKENSQDLDSFVRARLAQIKIPAENIQTLREAILKRASGSFQWTRLVLQDLIKLSADGRSVKELLVRLQDLPTELNDLYQKLLESLPEERKSESLHLMQWIMFAFRPLTITELRYAMVIDADSPSITIADCISCEDFAETDIKMEKRVTSLSAGLVEVIEIFDERPIIKSFGERLETGGFDICFGVESNYERSKKIVQFIHQTVVDYLRSSQLQALGPCDWKHIDGQSHFRLSRSCIRCINLEEVVNLDTGLSFEPEANPFLSYSDRYWISHVEKVEEAGIPQTDLLQRFFWPSREGINCWMNRCRDRLFYMRYPFWHTGPTILHIVIYLNLLSALNAVNDRHSIDCQDGIGRSVLHVAVDLGNLAATRILIAKGASIDHSDRHGVTPLMAAVMNDQIDAASLLLEHAANIEQIDEFGRTLLSHAASYAKVSTAEWLVEKGARLDIPDHAGRTPLSYAADSDKEDTVKFMLERGTSPNTPDHHGLTPLHWAANYRSSTASLKALLDGGASINAQDNNKNTALTCAFRCLTREYLWLESEELLTSIDVKFYVRSLEAVIFLLEKTTEISEKDLRSLDDIWSFLVLIRKRCIFDDEETRNRSLGTLEDLHKRVSGILMAKGLISDPGYEASSSSLESLLEH